MASAFVIKNDGINNTLKSTVILENEDKTLKTIALWDTGATNSCISMDVARDLGLISTGKAPMHTPSGGRIADTYLVNVILPNNVPVPGLMVCDYEIGDQGIGMLIGMDIITKGDFAVSNYNGKTVFTFRTPSEETTDYVAKIRARNVMGPPHGTGIRKKKRKK